MGGFKYKVNCTYKLAISLYLWSLPFEGILGQRYDFVHLNNFELGSPNVKIASKPGPWTGVSIN